MTQRMKTLISPYNDLMNDLLDATAFSLKPSSRIFSQLDFWQEKEDGFYVEKDIPGFSKKDVKATLENNEVTISGEIELRDSTKRLNFKVKIPENADEEKISIEVKNGVLRMSLPKSQKEKAQKINVM